MPVRSLSELEHAAAEKLPADVWQYVQGGAGEERALRRNVEAYRHRTLLPRGLSGVDSVDLRTTLLGGTVSTPVFLCPCAYLGDVHPDGERGVARAAARAGALSVFSTLSTDSLERIAQEPSTAPRWFQLYLQPDLAETDLLVRRAERAGFAAIVLTVDAPVFSVRDRQGSGGFALDRPRTLGNGERTIPPLREPRGEGGRYASRAELAHSWEILDHLRSVTALPIVVKGLLTAADALEARAHGAKGIVVSNHGGRQLDAAPAPLEVLPDLVAAVGPDVEVYCDGGVRRGTDVLIALALGARAVGIGRPYLWGLAADGEAGVGRTLELVNQELVSGMFLTGRANLAALDAGLLGPRP